eukprot:TRINITY_DN10458_c0_g1_i1.p2 TRINITY_DN10458_c0_g1~~TRINITY_DN10458_c0_g1_i1.p2  ORF type:complete len:226 (-),score=69.51 TRINITY_DN10458_c0_g1_i1:197-874(-)
MCIRDRRWAQKETKQLNTPNMLKFIESTDHLFIWVKYQILSNKYPWDIKRRMDKFIEIAEECRKISSFNAMYVIFESLKELRHQKKLWNAITSIGLRDTISDKVEEWDRFFDEKNKFNDFEKRLKECKPPCVPTLCYFTMKLRDKDLVPDYTNFNINIYKHHKIEEQLSLLLKFQESPFSLPKIKDLYRYFKYGIAESLKEAGFNMENYANSIDIFKRCLESIVL